VLANWDAGISGNPGRNAGRSTVRGSEPISIAVTLGASSESPFFDDASTELEWFTIDVFSRSCKPYFTIEIDVGSELDTLINRNRWR